MKQLRVKVLERVIKHMIHGDKDRAARLMEKLMAAVGSQIVNEANYGSSDDPMFPARRELQRELEDDIDQDRVDMEPGEGDELEGDGAGLEGDCAPGDECSPEAVATMIADLVKAGGVDEDKLAQIVDILVGEEGEEGLGEPGDDLEGDLPPDEGLEGDLGGDLPPDEGLEGDAAIDKPFKM